MKTTFAFFLLEENVRKLTQGVKLLAFSLRDSIDILQSNDYEFLNRDFLDSDNVEDAIEEQNDLEHNFYNQLFVLFVTHVDSFLKEVFLLDIKIAVDNALDFKTSVKEHPDHEGKSTKKEFQFGLKWMGFLNNEFFHVIAKGRRGQLLQDIFRIFEFPESDRSKYGKLFESLSEVRNQIVHNKSRLIILSGLSTQDTKLKEALSHLNLTNVFINGKLNFNSDLLLAVIKFVMKSIREMQAHIHSELSN